MDLEIRCLTLDERLSEAYEPLGTQSTQASSFLDLWIRIALGGREDLFPLRLQRDGLDEASVLSRLGPVTRRHGFPQPEWLADAEAILVDASDLNDGGEDRTSTETPFGPVLAPLVRGAEKALLAEVSSWKDIPATLRHTATRQLWQSLTDLLGLPLMEAFETWRTAEDGRGFQDFVDHLRAGGFVSLIDRYPVLARLCGVMRRRWITSYGRFVTRLVKDQDLLQSSLLDGQPLDLLDLRYGLSDPHGDGDAVLELRLVGGSSLFYKPRSLATDDLVAAFVGRLDLPDDLALRVPRHLDRGDYGWVLGVAPDECVGSGDVRTYYRRAGAWLGCFHLLGATDIHMENVIASGAHPVPIDFETILQAIATRPKTIPEGKGAHWAASHRLETSVLSIGLLPGYMRGEDGASFSVGGLEASKFDVKRLIWSNLNTDAMTVSLETQSVEISGNLPQLKGKKIPLDAHRKDVLDGLQEFLGLACSRKVELEDLLESRRSQGLKVRRVIRPTRFYYLLLRRLTDHRVMGDGVTWGLQAELIARLYDWDDLETQPWKLFRSERKALYRLTIPAFQCDSDRTVAEDRHGPVTNLHAKNGLDVSLQRLAALDDEVIGLEHSLAAAALGHPGSSRDQRISGDETDFVLSIARHLERRAIREDHSAAWLGLEYLDHRLMSQVIPMGHELYNGQVGIGLFLAAAGRARGDERALRLASHAIEPIKSLVRSRNRHRLVRTMGIGGYLGLGSLAYGLSACSTLLGDQDAFNAAEEAADLICTEAVLADQRHDLMGGAAGAILSLIALDNLSKSGRWLERAQAVAEGLCAKPRPPGGPWVSAIFDNRPLTGLSHGASGYALAFAHLAQRTGRPDYRAVAEECLAFEERAYDTTQRNWRDTRPDSFRRESRSPNQWCYGAVGIGYARLALPGLRSADLSTAIDSVLKAQPLSNDTLCCGTAGRADFLIAAGRALEDPALVRTGQDLLENVQAVWRETADACWDMGDKDFNLGLMRGVAGLGYAVLRSENASLPNVLLLQ
jgi:type 2 lantibiotic biosynthesis protein LanM